MAATPAFAAWGYLAVGALATLSYALVDGNKLRANIVFALSLGAVTAVLVGIWRYRPVPVLPWYLFAAAHALYFVGWIFWEIPIVREGAPPASFSLADLFFLASYPLFALGLLLIIRARDADRGRALEVAIIGAAAALLSWVILFEPFVQDHEIAASLRATQSVYGLMDILIAAVVVRALFGATRGTSYRLVLAGLVCLLVSDTSWNWLSLAAEYTAGSYYDLGWLAFVVLFGAAAVHPSMRNLARPPSDEPGTARWAEIGVLAVGLFADAAISERGAVAEVISFVLALLVLTRFVVLLRESDSLGRRLVDRNLRLVELDRQKDDFIASISHELRTPLTSIRGYLDLVREGDPGPLTDEQEKFLGVVDRNADRLLRVVGDLLFVAQAGDSKLDLSIDDLEVEELVGQAAEVARPQAKSRDIELACETRAVPTIRGDRARLGQVLDNLVSNAIKFTPSGGRVRIAAFAENGNVVLEVSDTGTGISPDEQEQLFARFYRAPAASQQAIPGTGLGLTIVKAIVEAHHGTIGVTSSAGAGSTFRVVLPANGPE